MPVHLGKLDRHGLHGDRPAEEVRVRRAAEPGARPMRLGLLNRPVLRAICCWIEQTRPQNETGAPPLVWLAPVFFTLYIQNTKLTKTHVPSRRIFYLSWLQLVGSFSAVFGA